MRFLKRFMHSLLFLVVVAAAIAIVMLLWNALVPEIIGWSAINYWQAAGLLILSRLLLGGLGRHWHHAHHAHHGHCNGASFREKMEWRKEMKGMSHEERRNFIRRKMFCGCDESSKETASSGENRNSQMNE